MASAWHHMASTTWHQDDRLKECFKKVPPSKAAGTHGTPSYCWKKVKSLLPAMLRIVIKETTVGTNQNWLYEGRTWLFTNCGKGEKDESVLITCLNTFYKIVSAIVARKLRNYVKEKNLSEEKNR